MRECWNRQTGTFEVRVSLTCGFKSHLSHQTPFRFWAVFFCAYKAKAVRISEPLFRLYSAVKRLQCAVWWRCLVYARGAFYQIKMRCRGQCPTDIRGWYVYGCENRLSFHILPPWNRLFRCCLKGAIQGLRTVFPKARWQVLCRGSPDLSPILRLPCRWPPAYQLVVSVSYSDRCAVFL